MKKKKPIVIREGGVYEHPEFKGQRKQNRTWRKVYKISEDPTAGFVVEFMLVRYGRDRQGRQLTKQRQSGVVAMATFRRWAHADVTAEYLSGPCP